MFLVIYLGHPAKARIYWAPAAYCISSNKRLPSISAAAQIVVLIRNLTIIHNVTVTTLKGLLNKYAKN